MQINVMLLFLNVKKAPTRTSTPLVECFFESCVDMNGELVISGLSTNPKLTISLGRTDFTTDVSTAGECALALTSLLQGDKFLREYTTSGEFLFDERPQYEQDVRVLVKQIPADYHPADDTSNHAYFEPWTTSVWVMTKQMALDVIEAADPKNPLPEIRLRQPPSLLPRVMLPLYCRAFTEKTLAVFLTSQRAHHPGTPLKEPQQLSAHEADEGS